MLCRLARAIRLAFSIIFAQALFFLLAFLVQLALAFLERIIGLGQEAFSPVMSPESGSPAATLPSKTAGPRPADI